MSDDRALRLTFEQHVRRAATLLTEAAGLARQGRVRQAHLTAGDAFDHLVMAMQKRESSDD